MEDGRCAIMQDDFCGCLLGRGTFVPRLESTSTVWSGCRGEAGDEEWRRKVVRGRGRGRVEPEQEQEQEQEQEYERSRAGTGGESSRRMGSWSKSAAIIHRAQLRSVQIRSIQFSSLADERAPGQRTGGKEGSSMAALWHLRWFRPQKRRNSRVMGME